MAVARFKTPNVSEEDQTMLVHRTNDVVLSSCQQVDSVPPPIIKWIHKKDGKLPSNTHILPSGNLLISNVRFATHGGMYYCVARNNVTNESWSSPTINLKRAPPSKFCTA